MYETGTPWSGIFYQKSNPKLKPTEDFFIVPLSFVATSVAFVDSEVEDNDEGNDEEKDDTPCVFFGVLVSSVHFTVVVSVRSLFLDCWASRSAFASTNSWYASGLHFRSADSKVLRKCGRLSCATPLISLGDRDR